MRLKPHNRLCPCWQLNRSSCPIRVPWWNISICRRKRNTEKERVEKSRRVEKMEKSGRDEEIENMEE